MIVIERGVLRSDIRAPHFQFIYQTFQENGCLSIFYEVNIYPQLIHKFYMNLKPNAHYATPYVESKVCSTKLHITPEVISEVSGIPLTPTLSTPFPNTVTLPPRVELMECLNPNDEYEWEEHRNKIPSSYLCTPECLLARIVMQNMWSISRNSEDTLDRARLIFSIINQVPFCMCKHMVMTMIELQAKNNIALPFGGLITKILRSCPSFLPLNRLRCLKGVL
jgi:hypothetical protein